MYGNTDYINYDTFNEVEDNIETLTSQIREYTLDLPWYDKTTWNLNDWIFLEKVKNIEQGIENLKKYYAKPSGWIETRDWTISNSYSYIDINRWLNNLNLIAKIIKEYEARYCGSFKCGEEVAL